MQNKTLFDETKTTSYKNIANKSILLDLINHAITNFCNSLGFKKNYFSKYLKYSDSQFLKYINPDDDTHNLKITDLEIILFNLDEENKKILLDYLCYKNGFICISEEHLKNDNNNTLENLLLTLTATNGELSKKYLDYFKDGLLTDLEKKELIALSYDFRNLLIRFENRVNLRD